MVRIIIDKETQAKLFKSNGVIELVDESGKLLGRILPHESQSHEGWEPLTPELSEEELDRLSKIEGPTTTSEEFLARLRSKR